MRSGAAASTLLLVLLLPLVGNGQVSQTTGAPTVTAADAGWQIRGERIEYAGAFYYAAGPTVFFSRNVMVPVGSYRGVPLYVDTTEEPYSVIYLPVGGNLMRPYERRRAGDLGGTEGSRTPAFPVESDATAVATDVPPPVQADVQAQPRDGATPVGTSGSLGPRIGRRLPRVVDVRPPEPEPDRLESLPRPHSNAGIWLEYAGTAWRLDGGSVQFSAAKFEEVGQYHGFPVFVLRGGPRDVIYVPSVEGGPLTRYRR